MAHQPATNSQFMRLGLWTFASIAAVASAAALYFASRSHHEHLRGAAFATQLSMKEQELSEKQSELERSKSALARLARAAKKTTPLANAPIVAPAPSSSPDSHAQPGSEAFEKSRRQDSLAWLRSIYDPLLTQLNLFPEQRARFYELRLAGDDSQGLSPDSEEELRKMFGARGFQLYQSYASTEQERAALLQFQQQTEANSVQIADWQYDRLLEALIQARKQSPQTPEGTADALDAALGQAAQFLTPDQLESARNHFHTQAEVMRAFQKLIPALGLEEMTPPGK